MSSPKELLMRYTPVALALSALAVVSASSGSGAPAPQPLDPRVTALVQQGRAALAGGQTDAAIDAYESALSVQPGNVVVLLSLAEATRREGMQGKALGYYRDALMLDPNNQYAIAGEGAALVEKGAVEKARRNLARLEQLCGRDCTPAQQLAAAIAKGPAPRVVTASDVTAKPTVAPN
jgi:Tfp pilus assembly protein PilF